MDRHISDFKINGKQNSGVLLVACFIILRISCDPKSVEYFIFFFIYFILPPETYLQCVYIGK